jgi:hypothetical protein
MGTTRRIPTRSTGTRRIRLGTRRVRPTVRRVIGPAGSDDDAGVADAGAAVVVAARPPNAPSVTRASFQTPA